MTQKRLNNLMLLHVHQERLDKLDLLNMAEEFVRGSKHRLSLLGHFVKLYLQSALFSPI